MKLSLPLIALLSIAPILAMDAQEKRSIIERTLERAKNVSAEHIQQKSALAAANLAEMREEIAQEEDARWRMICGTYPTP